MRTMGAILRRKRPRRRRRARRFRALRLGLKKNPRLKFGWKKKMRDSPISSTSTSSSPQAPKKSSRPPENSPHLVSRGRAFWTCFPIFADLNPKSQKCSKTFLARLRAWNQRRLLRQQIRSLNRQAKTARALTMLSIKWLRNTPEPTRNQNGPVGVLAWMGYRLARWGQKWSRSRQAGLMTILLLLVDRLLPVLCPSRSTPRLSAGPWARSSALGMGGFVAGSTVPRYASRQTKS